MLVINKNYNSMTNIQKTSKGKEIIVFNDNSKDIRNIAFEPINDDYSWVDKI